MKKLSILLVFLTTILVIGLFFQNDIMNFYSELFLDLPEIEKGISNLIVQEIERKAILPPPLKSQDDYLTSVLTKAGVIQWTNNQRMKYGLSPLLENAKLNIGAQIKVEDMFKNQYFGHTSPFGQEVKDLAENVDYQFIIIGENLALGNFKDDEHLVQAWMDSPGHRENILNPHYQELGVAVAKSNFEGKTVWLAVQHFGLSSSACLSPSEELKVEISINEAELTELEKTLATLKTDIQLTRPKRGQEYADKLAEYNWLVSQYNNLVAQTKNLIEEYNQQISSFNECLSGLK